MQYWRTTLCCLAIGSLSMIGTRVALRAAIEIVCGPASEHDRSPAVQLRFTEQEVPVEATGARMPVAQLTIAFPLKNAGQRRLVVQPVRRPCCDPPGREPTILDPGESTSLVLKVDPAELLKSSEYSQAFNTNDPRRPKFRLTVRPTPTPTPTLAAGPSSSLDGQGVLKSVLVKRP
jgi:hypothetical protein